MTCFSRSILAGLALLAGAAVARADEPMDGSFRAIQSCDALQSIRKDTNPGDVITGPGLTYQLLAANQKKQPTHYRIIVPGAEPPERWVAADCGSVIPATPDAAAQPAPSAKPAPAAKPGARDYVLALSWQPAFCESNDQKPECRWQNANRYDANYLSLHGLWPQPESLAYCNLPKGAVDAGERGRWKDLPPVRLSLSTQADLAQMMPGSQSMLERHEWAKHGTCYPGDAEAYFRDSFRLMRELNGSPVADLFLASVGRPLTAANIRAAFDQAFGKGAGNRVRVTCKDVGERRLITEISISLRGDIPAGTSLSDLILAAGPSGPGCPAGILDPVGTQ